MGWVEEYRRRGKLGLVLAGGGARGAYQVGVLRALADAGFEPDVVAGTSVGSLNGVLVAQAPTLAEAAAECRRVWEEMSANGVIKLNLSRLAVDAASISAGSQILAPQLRTLALKLSAKAALYAGQELTKDEAWFDPEPIENALRARVRPEAVRNGRPFHVTVAKAWAGMPDFPFRALVDAAIARARGQAATAYLRVNDLPPEQMMEAVLASAALPLAFPSRFVDGKRFIDGGVTDNEPLRGLDEYKCSLVVVVHLENGSIWRPHRDDVQVLEIRPQEPVQSDETTGIGWLRSLVDFRPEVVARLIERGEKDARELLGRLDRLLGVHAAATEQVDALIRDARAYFGGRERGAGDDTQLQNVVAALRPARPVSEEPS